MTPHILFYVQHLLGIGHVQRAATITRALVRNDVNVTVVLGGPAVPLADFGGADIRQLPSVRAADSSFKLLVDEYGNAIGDDWRDNRRRELMRVYEDVNPDLFLIELFPFGRYQFRFELLPLLEEINHKIPVVCSVRDVLVRSNKPDRDQKITSIIDDYFDHILVHGDENLISLESTFPIARQFSNKLTYTGYVTEEKLAEAPLSLGADEVIVSAGSGAVGENLLRIAMAARSLSKLSHKPWRFLAGDYLPEPVFKELQSSAPEGVCIERAREDFRALLPNALLSISQGGYNTVMDVLSAKCPAVIVPFADGDEGEQTFRARKLAKTGLLHMLEADALSAETLADVINAAISIKSAASIDFDMSGAETTARLIRNMT